MLKDGKDSLRIAFVLMFMSCSVINLGMDAFCEFEANEGLQFKFLRQMRTVTFTKRTVTFK